MLSAWLRRRWVKWGFAFLFWTSLGLIFSTQTYLYLKTQYHGFTWWDALKNGMPIWYIWGMLAPVIVGFDHRLPVRREQILQRIALHLPLSVLAAGLHFMSRLGVEKIFHGEVTLGFADLLGSFPMTLQIYWLILGVAVSYDFFQAYRERELQASQLQARLTEARLHALRAQLHPHFLFNTLNAISAFIEKSPQTARQMTAHLGELLRFALEHAERQEITLAEELSFLENYLEIQRIRFADRLEIQLHIAPETLNALVPSLLLQPLVENAIRHGLSPRAARGRLALHAQREGNFINLSISDDGVGLPENWQAAARHGVGLSNTRERLEKLYAGAHRFVIRNSEGGGVTVELTLPLRLELNFPNSNEQHSHFDR